MAVLIPEEGMQVYPGGRLTNNDLAELYQLWIGGAGQRINGNGMVIGYEDTELADRTDAFLSALQGSTGQVPTVTRSQLLGHFFDLQSSIGQIGEGATRSPDELAAAEDRVSGRVVISLSRVEGQLMRETL